MLEPLPEQPSPLKSPFNKALLITFVASVAGILLSIGICANTQYNSDRATIGLIIFAISLLGVIISTIAGIIKVLIALFKN